MLRPNKYNVAPKHLRTVDGVTFDSAAEAYRWSELLLLQRAGLISNLRRQVRIELIPRFTRNGRPVLGVDYIADFAYLDQDGHEIFEDLKGHRTAVYIIKRKMLLYLKPEIDFREVPARR